MNSFSNPKLSFAIKKPILPEKNLDAFSQIKDLSSKFQTNENSSIPVNIAEKPRKSGFNPNEFIIPSSDLAFKSTFSSGPAYNFAPAPVVFNNFTPAPAPSDLNALEGQNATTEKKIEFTEKANSKIKKCLRPINQRFIEFIPSTLTISGEILQNNFLSETTTNASMRNNEKSFARPILSGLIQVEEMEIFKSTPLKRKMFIDIISISRKRLGPVPLYLNNIISREVLVEVRQGSNIKSQKPLPLNQDKPANQVQSKNSFVKKTPPADNNCIITPPPVAVFHLTNIPAPSYLSILETQEKENEIAKKWDSKMKKILKPLNQSSVEFKPSILPIVADIPLKKEDLPNWEQQKTKNYDFQPSQKTNYEKEFSEKIKNMEKLPLHVKKSLVIDTIKMSRKGADPVPSYLKDILSREILVEAPQKSKYLKSSFSNYQNKQVNQVQTNASPIKETLPDNNDFITAPLDSFKQNFKDQSKPSPVKETIPNKEELLTSSKDSFEKKFEEKKNEFNQKIAEKKLNLNHQDYLKSSVKSIVDKIAPENFDVLKKGIIEIARIGKEECDVVVTLIIKKAWAEPEYSEICAKMCYFLQTDKNLAYETKDGKSTKNYFKSKLFDTIQEEFEGREKNEKEEGKKTLTPEEKEKQILGNVKFIGELYLQKVIPKKIIQICICSMLSKYQKEYYRFFLEGKEDYKNYEYHLEGVIALIDKVGKEFDKNIKEDSEKQKESEQIKKDERKNLSTYQRKMKKLNKDAQCFSEKKIMRIDPESLISLERVFEMLIFIKDNLASSNVKHLIENLFEKKTSGWKEEFYEPRNYLKNTVNLIFDKLTPENFDVLKKGIIDIARKGKEECDAVITLLIKKAWTEVKYAKTYAEMCYFLQTDKNLAYETKDGKSTKNYFKSKLFDIIQEEFEGREKAEKEEGKKTLTPEEKKKQILGNVKFIGELYLQKVIPKKIIHICICSMLSKYQEEYYRYFLEEREDYKNYEYHLEGVIALIDKVGREFDKKIKEDSEKQKESEQIKKNERKNLSTYQREMKELNKDVHVFSEKKIMRIDPESLISLDGVFEMLSFIKDNLSCSNVKHLLENLFEKKESGWKEAFFSNDRPQKIIEKEQDEISKRALEFAEKEYMNESKIRSEKKETMDAKNITTPLFSVTGESKFQQIIEERKDSPKNKHDVFDIPKNTSTPNMKLNFILNKNKEEMNFEKEDQKLSKNEINKTIKSIFKKMENHYEDLEEGKQAPYDDFKAFLEFIFLIQKSNHRYLLSSFFQSYYEIYETNNKSQSSALIKNRINVLFKLVNEGHIPKDIFLKEFSLHLSRLWSFIADYPFLNKLVAEMFFLFNKANLLMYEELLIDWSGGVEDNSEDPSDDIVFVLKDFIEESYKLLKENGLESKREESLKSLIEKIQDCSPEWFEKMKKRLN